MPNSRIVSLAETVLSFEEDHSNEGKMEVHGLIVEEMNNKKVKFHIE